MTEGETVQLTNGSRGSGDTNLDTSTTSEHDPHYEPIISLPEVTVPTLEEDEEEMIQLRAKLYRFDSSETPSEWKERGTGNVKLLRHKITNAVRVVMRRDKTHKICANHFVTPWMSLSPNCGSDRAWVWSVPADLTYDKACPELLAIRFATAEQARLWKTKFEEAKKIVEERCNFCKEEEEEEEEDDDDDDDEEEEESPKEEDDEGSPKEEDDEEPPKEEDDEEPPKEEEANKSGKEDKQLVREEEVTQKMKALEVNTGTAKRTCLQETQVSPKTTVTKPSS